MDGGVRFGDAVVARRWEEGQTSQSTQGGGCTTYWIERRLLRGPHKRKLGARAQYWDWAGTRGRGASITVGKPDRGQLPSFLRDGTTIAWQDVLRRQQIPLWLY
jgi:hypothetical protein